MLEVRDMSAEPGAVEQPMYEVWWSCGRGTQCGPRFRLLDDALRYVAEHAAEASFAIRRPDGTWHQFCWGAHQRGRARRSA